MSTLNRSWQRIKQIHPACIQCGQPFMGDTQAKKCNVCKAKRAEIHPWCSNGLGRQHKRNCRTCGIEFIGHSPNNITCSSCRKEHRSCWYRYGLTQQAYDKLLSSQNYACAICSKPFDMQPTVGRGCHKNKPTVDHCHQTGRVRGLLCNTCNGYCAIFDSVLLERVKIYVGAK